LVPRRNRRRGRPPLTTPFSVLRAAGDERVAALGVVFDLDGVLADTSSAHARAYADVWRAANVRGVPYSEIAGRRTQDVLDDLLTEVSDRERQKLVALKRRRARVYLETADVGVPGADELLQALQKAKIRLGLVTGACRRSARALLERERLSRFFDVVVTADDVSRGKPDAAGYRRALRSMGVPAERGLVVEDSCAGIQSALSAGAWTVSVHSGQRASHARFCGSFPTLRALHDWLLGREAAFGIGGGSGPSATRRRARVR
jgi:HAD superfamily hydrolase (TIGR01509 family)